VNYLVRQLGKYQNEFDYCTFSNIEEFRSFIKTHKDDYDIFIAVGGDGTVNSLASELIGSGKILGVYPTGSGNGFAREMRFKKNLKTLAEDIRRKETIEIDVLFINDVPSINVSGIGLDSIVAHEFHNLTRRGKWNYGIAALKTVAGIANMTPNAFCRYFKNVTRKTLVESVRELRINQACQLLRNTVKPINEICFESGFGNISYFNKTFKEASGYTPLHYRNFLKLGY